MAVLVGVLLCGLMCVSVNAQASVADLLRPDAISYTGPLPCNNWDCDCTFREHKGCCCAADDMYNLEEETFMRVKSLWYRITDLEHHVDQTIASRKIAFKATIDPNIVSQSSVQCFGPFSSNVPIPYGVVSLNDGNGYNPALGVFTAPRDGVYVFSFTVYSSVSHTKLLSHKVQLMKNGKQITSVWENNRDDSEDSGTETVILEVKAGCQVYLELLSGRELCKNLELNIFTGYMLYAS